MKIKWLARNLCLIALTAVLQGCATYLASQAEPGKSDFYNQPVLTDEILAIGKPDEMLLKQMDLSNTIAFIGKQHTYMLYLGGEELEQISKLKLDARRMKIDSGRNLYLKDKQVWGEIELFYNNDKNGISAEEVAELKLGGFTPDTGARRKGDFKTTIRIEGVVYPAIKIPDEQLSKLSVRRKFNLHNPREASPPVLGKVLKVPLVAAGIATDVMLAPVYMGLGAVVLVGAVASGAAR